MILPQFLRFFSNLGDGERLIYTFKETTDKQVKGTIIDLDY